MSRQTIELGGNAQKVMENDGSVTVKFKAGSPQGEAAKNRTGYRRWNSVKDRHDLLTDSWLCQNILPFFTVGEIPR